MATQAHPGIAFWGGSTPALRVQSAEYISRLYEPAPSIGTVIAIAREALGSAVAERFSYLQSFEDSLTSEEAPLNLGSVRAAVVLLIRRPTPMPDIVANPRGNIFAEWKVRGMRIAGEFLPDGSVVVLAVDPAGRRTSSTMTLAELQGLLTGIVPIAL